MNAHAKIFDSTFLKRLDAVQGSFDESLVDVLSVEESGCSTSSCDMRGTKESVTAVSDMVGKAFKAVQKPQFYKVEAASVEWVDIVQSWEGRIIAVDSNNNELTAVITDRTNRSHPDEEVVIDLSAIKKSDLSLVQEGAVFYWNIGKMRTNKRGTIKNASDIRMRRLPGFNKAQLDRARTLGKSIAERLHAD